jgi:hypothetical protein
LATVDQLAITQGAYPIGWNWQCAETPPGRQCDHIIRLVTSQTHGVLFTPWMLRFAAKQNDPLPPAQSVRLWTGAAVMPWRIQPQSSWLDVRPSAGETALTISVQPNTTALPIGTYTDAAAITSAPATTSLMEVIYDVFITTEVSGTVVPADIELEQNYPNPASGISNFEFRISREGDVRLTLHDMLGREVATLFEGRLSFGRHRVRFDATRLPPGIYVCMLASGNISRTIMIVKE